VKLIRCNNCEDVVRLIERDWRSCDCGESGGQYNQDMISATVGGDCEVIGLRNDFFKEKPFSKKRGEDGKNIIIQGEYLGDNQIHRIDSGKGPRLKMDITENGDDTHDITFTDKRKYTINVKGKDKSPKTIKGIPSNSTPSFKDKKTKKESILDDKDRIIIENFKRLIK
jgi:hypothetical protein